MPLPLLTYPISYVSICVFCIHCIMYTMYTFAYSGTLDAYLVFQFIFYTFSIILCRSRCKGDGDLPRFPPSPAPCPPTSPPLPPKVLGEGDIDHRRKMTGLVAVHNMSPIESLVHLKSENFNGTVDENGIC